MIQYNYMSRIYDSIQLENQWELEQLAIHSLLAVVVFGFTAI